MFRLSTNVKHAGIRPRLSLFLKIVSRVVVCTHLPSKTQDSGGSTAEALQSQFIHWILYAPIGQLTLGVILQLGFLRVFIHVVHLIKKKMQWTYGKKRKEKSVIVIYPVHYCNSLLILRGKRPSLCIFEIQVVL